MTKSTVIRRGKAALPRPAESKFLKVPEGEAITVVLLAGLDDLISVDQHAFWEITPAVFVPCTGVGCPACKLGNKPGFKAFLPVLTGDGAVRVFSFGISILRQLETLEEELGSLVGQVIKIRRHGSGLTTKYTVVAVGKKASTKGVEIPDIVSMLGPTDREGIKRVLVEAGLLEEEERDTSTGVAPKAKTERKAKPVHVEESEPEEQNEEEEWGDETSWEEA